MAIESPTRTTSPSSPGGSGRIHPQRKQLDWVGFVSNADAKTVYYLDNLSLANDAK